jgi:hypothetical protein
MLFAIQYAVENYGGESGVLEEGVEGAGIWCRGCY